jgi:replicative DNA helicase
MQVDHEASLIGAILLEPRQIDRVASLVDEEDFLDPAARLAWRCAVNMHQSGKIVDLFEIGRIGRTQLPGFVGWLAKCSTAGIAANAERYAERVRSSSHLRGLKSIVTLFSAKLDSLAGSDPESVSEAAKWLQAKAAEFANVGDEKRVRQLGECCSDALADVRAAMDAALGTGLASGFRAIDGVTGGVFRGELTTIAARPGIGKTSLGIQIARSVAYSGLRSLVFSLEMTGKELAARSICSVAEISGNRLRTGTTSEDEYSRLSMAAGELSGLDFLIDDRSTIDAHQIISTAKLAAADKPIDLVVVDYIGLVKPSPNVKTRNRAEQVSEVTKALKSLAKECDCAVIALSQVNREAAKEGWLQLHHLKESGAIEEDSNAIWFIQRSESKVEIEIAKNRNGQTGRFEIIWEPEFTRFRDVSISDMPNYDPELADW